MGTRLELHSVLCDVIGNDHVYFQPPSSIIMSYPSIVYELNRVYNTNADDSKYIKHRRYAIKYISRDPDNTVIDRLLAIPYCSFDRRFVVDNLYHDCFDLYF